MQRRIVRGLSGSPMTRTAAGSPPLIFTPRRMASASPTTTGTHSLTEICVAQKRLRGYLGADACRVAERERKYRFGFTPLSFRRSAQAHPQRRNHRLS